MRDNIQNLVDSRKTRDDTALFSNTVLQIYPVRERSSLTGFIEVRYKDKKDVCINREFDVTSSHKNYEYLSLALLIRPHRENKFMNIKLFRI